MSTEAFGSRRVAESLRALGRYIDQAVEITEGVSPGETATLPTQPIQTTPITSIEKFIWNRTGDRRITLDPETSCEHVTVSGDNLDHITIFKLTGPGPSPKQFKAGSISIDPKDSTRFTATIDVDGSSPGSYQASATNSLGETFLLRHACHIKRRDDGSGSFLKLDAIYPNTLNETSINDVVLVAVKGKGHDYWIEDLEGARLAWAVSVRSFGHQDAQTFNRMHPGAHIHALTIDVPKTSNGFFVLVAETKDGARDRIAFGTKSLKTASK